MLNNKGWGLSTLVMCLAVILFFLLMSFIYATSFNKKIDEGNNDNIEIEEPIIDYNYYKELEKNMDKAAIKYINNSVLNIENNEMIMVSARNFIDFGYLENFVDSITKNECSGYSIIKNENKGYKVSSYINCDNYKTEGYGD